MSKKEIHEEINTLLTEGCLKQAIDNLSIIITTDTDWELYSRFDKVRNAYNYMLEYLRTDMPDPNREKLYQDLVGQCFILNDEIAQLNDDTPAGKNFIQFKKKYNNEINIDNLRTAFSEHLAYITAAHVMPKEKYDNIKMEVYGRHEALLREAFHMMRTTTNWNTQTCDEIYKLLTTGESPKNDAITLVTAITLGLFNCFEPQKAILLCRLSMNFIVELSMRALTGLVLALLMHQERIKFYPELRPAIESLFDDKEIQRRLHTLQIQLLLTRETMKINKKMRDEIIPAMLEDSNIVCDKNTRIKFDFDDLECNPEWQKIKKWADSEDIKEKLDEISQWQYEGADIYLGTFTLLKKYVFFDEMQNWVRPFEKDSIILEEMVPKDSKIGKTLIDTLSTSRFFCHSDKYSFAFSLYNLTEEQLEMMIIKIPEANEEEADNMPKPSTESQTEDTELISRYYLQDLYRLFKLSSFRNEHPDPFKMTLNMLESNELSKHVQSNDFALRVFNYLVDKEYYIEAENAGHILEKGKYSDAQFYQKMGYCMEKQNKFSQAIDYYTKADIMLSDSLWTLRRMAQCYRIIGEFDNALHYYNAALQISPEDKKLLLKTGECLVMLKRYDEAFAHFFKVEYIDPESLRARRAIAWCSFLTKNDTQARHYYQQIMQDEKVEADDILNAAHIEWVNNEHSKAYELYKKAEEQYGDTQKLISMIENDRAILMERGVSDFEIKLLKDLFY